MPLMSPIDKGGSHPALASRRPIVRLQKMGGGQSGVGGQWFREAWGVVAWPSSARFRWMGIAVHPDPGGDARATHLAAHTRLTPYQKMVGFDRKRRSSMI